MTSDADKRTEQLAVHAAEAKIGGKESAAEPLGSCAAVTRLSHTMPEDDRQKNELAKSADQSTDAFCENLKRTQDDLYAWFRQKGVLNDAAEHLVQVAALLALKHHDSYNPERNFFAWLKKEVAGPCFVKWLYQQPHIVEFLQRFDENKEMLRKLFRRKGVQACDLDDLVTKVGEQAVLSLHTYDQGRQLGPWLKTIAHRQFCRWLDNTQPLLELVTLLETFFVNHGIYNGDAPSFAWAAANEIEKCKTLVGDLKQLLPFTCQDAEPKKFQTMVRNWRSNGTNRKAILVKFLTSERLNSVLGAYSITENDADSIATKIVTEIAQRQDLRDTITSTLVQCFTSSGIAEDYAKFSSKYYRHIRGALANKKVKPIETFIIRWHEKSMAGRYPSFFDREQHLNTKLLNKRRNNDCAHSKQLFSEWQTAKKTAHDNARSAVSTITGRTDILAAFRGEKAVHGDMRLTARMRTIALAIQDGGDVDLDMSVVVAREITNRPKTKVVPLGDYDAVARNDSRDEQDDKTIAALKECLETSGLSEAERSALNYRYWEAFGTDGQTPIADVAKALDVKDTNARQILSRAIKKLKKCLNEKGFK